MPVKIALGKKSDSGRAADGGAGVIRRYVK
jgi:hypothetical protein